MSTAGLMNGGSLIECTCIRCDVCMCVCELYMLMHCQCKREEKSMYNDLHDTSTPNALISARNSSTRPKAYRNCSWARDC